MPNRHTPLSGKKDMRYRAATKPRIIRRRNVDYPSREQYTGNNSKEHSPWYAAQKDMQRRRVASSFERVMSSGICKISSSS